MLYFWYKIRWCVMRNTFKNSWKFIIILFVSIILPFNVEAKQTNTFIEERNFGWQELISGDTVSIKDYLFYTPVKEIEPIDDQEIKLRDKDKVITLEYYVIDSVDSNGNIKYKKYDYTKLDKSNWATNISSFYTWSGIRFDFNYTDNPEYYNTCIIGDLMYNDYGWTTDCNVFLPAVNGKIVRWRFGNKEQGDKKEIEVCKKYINNGVIVCSLCDKIDDGSDGTYIGKYEYYTSTVYKFYELPEEKPKTKITCDSNKLSAGETTKCKINFSYKYGLSNILFDIASDKLKINNFQINDYWNDYPFDDLDFSFDDSDYWSFREFENGYSINFTYDYLFDWPFYANPVIATFEVTTDEDVDDVVDSIEKSDIKYIDKTGDGISNGEEPIVDDNTGSDDNTNNILNPSTFRNSYYLIIGILIIGGICFIQLRSKKKNKWFFVK